MSFLFVLENKPLFFFFFFWLLRCFHATVTFWCPESEAMWSGLTFGSSRNEPPPHFKAGTIAHLSAGRPSESAELHRHCKICSTGVNVDLLKSIFFHWVQTSGVYLTVVSTFALGGKRAHVGATWGVDSGSAAIGWTLGLVPKRHQLDLFLL